MAPATHGLLAGYDYEDPKSMSRLAFSLQHWMKDQQASNRAYLHGLSPEQLSTLEVIRLQTTIDEAWNRLVGLFISTPRRSSKMLLKAAHNLANHAANLQDPRIQANGGLSIKDQAITSPTLSNQNTPQRTREAEAKPRDGFPNIHSTPPSSPNEKKHQILRKDSRPPSSSDNVPDRVDHSGTMDFENETWTKLQSLRIGGEMKKRDQTPPSEAPRAIPGLSQKQLNKLFITPKPCRQPFTVAASLRDDDDIEEPSLLTSFERKLVTPGLEPGSVTIEKADYPPAHADFEQHSTRAERDRKLVERLQEEARQYPEISREQKRILESYLGRNLISEGNSGHHVDGILNILPQLRQAYEFEHADLELMESLQYDSESEYSDVSTDEIVEEEEQVNLSEREELAAAIALSLEARNENDEGLKRENQPPQVLGKRSLSKDPDDTLPPPKRVDRGRARRGRKQ